MIPRTAQPLIESALSRQAAVALIGPRQVGKTTLAHLISSTRPSIYLDLEASADRIKLTEPVLFLNHHTDKLVVLDEIHRMPELFQELRGIIDEGRRRGKRAGRFLILGSASIDLIRQSGETLAGRIEYIDLGPFHALEIDTRNDRNKNELNRLWLRGGFPDSYLAGSDNDSYRYRVNLIRTYLEREIPLLGPRIPAEMLERFWTMLAHNQGTLLNASRLAGGLGISAPTVSNYIGLLVDLLLVRRLPPYQINLGKRLVKSPKTYVRDSGLVHALLGIETMDDLLGHPVLGTSWEGFVIESLLAVAPERAKASFYRTAAGAEIDLLIEFGKNEGIWAIEIKRSLSPKIEKNLRIALDDLKPSKAFIVYPGEDRYPIGDTLEVIGVRDMAREIDALSSSLPILPHPD